MGRHAREQQQEEEEARGGCSGEHVHTDTKSQIQMCPITNTPDILINMWLSGGHESLVLIVIS